MTASSHPLDRTGLQVIPGPECLELLASVPVGRVGFVDAGEVTILPVNHVVHGRTVVFRSAAGAKLATADRRSLVAFEVDRLDEDERTGWSVLIRGRAEEVEPHQLPTTITDRADLPWADGAPKDHWIRIRALEITGRRVAH